MRRYPLTLVPTMVLLLALAPTYGFGEDAAWSTDVRSAWKAAQSGNRPLLIFATSPHCPYCRKMESDMLANPAVARRIKDSYVPVAINTVDEAALSGQLRITSVPTTFVVLPDGRIADRIEGYVSPNKLQDRLDTVLRQMDSP